MLKEILINATEAGARVMQHYFTSKNLQISNKEGINNLVTEADHASEKAIMDTIKQQFPDHFILSEEAGEIASSSEYKWIIDPIDGTVNYAHGIPICCVSIGIEHNGAMVMGAVFNPFLKEFYFAEKGAGAMLNGELICVSNQTDINKSCLVTGFPYTYLDVPNGPLEVFSRFIRKGIPVRRLGSAAMDLCWVAAGRFDGFYEHKLQAWDSAAGFLIVEEAGGKVTDYKGEHYSPYQPSILATNGKIHDAVLLEINDESKVKSTKYEGVINRVYFNQLVKSSSSVGANYRAAQRAKSTNDFINKLKIVEEEADESVYFLELLLVEFNPDHADNIVALVREGTEILKIIVASINTSRGN